MYAQAPPEQLFDLWRGIKNRSVGDEFLLKGGTELAAMSTTCDLKVALEYAASASSVLLRICTTTVMQRGADLTFLSAFPKEAESAGQADEIERADDRMRLTLSVSFVRGSCASQCSFPRSPF